MKYELSARRLVEAMNDNGITQQELANKTGINKASISQWVNGKNVMGNLSAFEIGKTLGVAPEWLMGIPLVAKFDLNIEYHKMNEDQKKRLIAFMESLKNEDREDKH